MTRKMGEDKREVELHRFKPLEFFGERTFVTGKARTASCIAKGGGAEGGVRLWTLNKEDFKSIKPLLQHVLDDQMIFTVLKDIPQLEALAETARRRLAHFFLCGVYDLVRKDAVHERKALIAPRRDGFWSER